MQLISPPSQDQVYAAVDLGSNSFHLLVVEVVNDSMRIRSRVKQKVRLASGLDAKNRLDADSMQRGWDCLRVFAQQIESIPKENISIVATATLRLATNREEFIKKGSEILGKAINVISGEQEAQYIFNGVTSGKKHNLTSLVIDIGGASTELAFGTGTQASVLHSVNMGCVTYMHAWFTDQQLNEQCFKQAVSAAKQSLQPVLKDFENLKIDDCLGASGTPQAIIEILQARSLSATITLPVLYQIAEECCSAYHLDNLKIKGLAEARRAIFPAGLAILIALFESLPVSEMHLAQGALREGVLAELLPLESNRSREKILELFHTDLPQAHRVYRCCQQILANCAPEPELTPQLQKVMENACMLHEAGKVISFKNHHQHSRYLINQTNMAWLNFEEKQMIADIVGSNPASANFDKARLKQKQLGLLIRVLRLATILCCQRQAVTFECPQVQIQNENWTLSFRDNYLNDNPLLAHLLKEESQSIGRVNWQLEFQ